MRKRPLRFLLLSILSFGLLAGLIYFFPPNQTLSPLTSHLSLLTLFFPLLSLFLFATGTYIFKSKTHGILIALFADIYLIFRLTNLTHPFFLIILTALFLMIELFISYRK